MFLPFENKSIKKKKSKLSVLARQKFNLKILKTGLKIRGLQDTNKTEQPLYRRTPPLPPSEAWGLPRLSPSGLSDYLLLGKFLHVPSSGQSGKAALQGHCERAIMYLHPG